MDSWKPKKPKKRFVITSDHHKPSQAIYFITGRKHTLLRKISEPRERRSTPKETRRENTENSSKKRVCTIKFTTGPFVWRHDMDKHAQNKIRAVNEIHYMIRDHMQVLYGIFKETKFTVNHEKADEFTTSGFQFEVGEIMIWDERHCEDKLNVCYENLTFRELLDGFLLTQDDYKLDYYNYDNEYPDSNYTDSDYNSSTENFNYDGYQDDKNYLDEELTSMLFTARSITQGLTPVPIYGLGYSPDDEHTDCGICSTANVAFVNLYVSEEVPYQPYTRTKLVFAHEVAHAFGAPHDNNKTACGEYSILNEPDEGYFLMHEVAVTGDRENNFKFSNCSLDKMGTVVARESSTSCFKEPRTSICGNGIVEEGEQCDCGSICHIDNCCNRNGTKHECSLKQDAQCSQGKHGNTHIQGKELPIITDCPEEALQISTALKNSRFHFRPP
ncbi:uncharacterized protein LOC128237970 [Mya arenaria]|uniref:uncharacterized protein LOC128237970 n=1 Tax=Mya arenaria TaxID=6604 RepID=UPI0022DF6AD0|nr:uncharacterized protein LOC128237970 [Mya arenaria]